MKMKIIMKSRDRYIKSVKNRNGVGRIIVRCCFVSILFSIFNFQFSIAQEDLSKQLEVTRAYTPRVGQAEKLPIEPDMTDTVRLRPAVSYSITSTASATSFSTRPYEPASIAMAPFDMQHPLYIRAGAGGPFRTVFDLYFTPRMRTGSTFGLFANHSGAYSKIENDLGFEAAAAEMSNGAGMWGSRKWRRYSLEGDLTYDHRGYDPYGVADIDLSSMQTGSALIRNFVYDRSRQRLTFGLLRGGLGFGDDFSDLSRFNFRVAFDGGWARLNGGNQINLNAGITLAKMFGEGKHGFELALSERGAFGPSYATEGSDVILSGNALTATLAPKYLMEAGVWSLRAGVDVRYVGNRRYGQDHLRFSPSFELRADLANGAFVPFASYTSRTIDGDEEALSRRNPYVTKGGTTAWVDDARIGFSGDLGDIFSYKIAGGFSAFDDYQLLIGNQTVAVSHTGDGEPAAPGQYDFSPMRFEPFAVDGTRFTAGAEFALHNLGGFGARIYGNWNDFAFNGLYAATPVGDLPRYDAGTELSYTYKDIVSIRLGADLTGTRDYLVRYNVEGLVPSGSFVTATLPTAVDIFAGVEAKVADDFRVWIEGRNLAGQKLYPQPGYRGFGASVMAGVKLLF